MHVSSRRRFAVALCIGGLLLANAWMGEPRAEDAPALGESDAGQSIPWVGVQSCSATACHGGAARTKNGEYTTWITLDPHARAYSVLFDEISLRIARNLDGPNAAPPHENQTCLACHTTGGGHAAPAPAYLGDGVGCESCHGAAGGWVESHARMNWQVLTPDEKSAERRRLGMLDTRDPLIRARQCVDCHVGGPQGEVNHDLIAAGHPRLAFELGGYLAELPRHWSTNTERASDPAFEARVWAVGQAVAAEAALGLLAHRAEKGEVWPEFAEYDCFACHHDLKIDGWRQARGFRGRPGSLPWGSCYLAPSWMLAVEGAADALPALDLEEHALASDGDESQLIGRMGAAFPDRKEIARQARAAQAALAAWAEELNQPSHYDRQAVSALLAALAEDRREVARWSWDNCAQLYLALAALAQAERDLAAADGEPAANSQEVIQKLRELREMLQFTDEDDGRYASPTDFDPRLFRTDLKAFQRLLRPE